MHIAYVTETYPPEINGVALTVARTVAYLRARGHAVEVVRPAQSGEARGAWEGDWRTVGCPIPVYPDMRFGLALPSALAQRFTAIGADLVHVATEGPLGRAAITAARQLGVRTTSDFRTRFHSYSNYYGIGFLRSAIEGYLRRFHNATDRTFVPTERLRIELADAGFERLEVIGRGVDLHAFSPAHRDPALRHAWDAADDAPVLLYVGRLAAEKQVGLALRAFRSALHFEPRARMVVVGDGPRRGALERACPEARFVGTQSGAALAAHYASADLFLFPSESETFGNVTMEALASGVPVIAFDSGAAAEHVRDRVCGRLVAPGDHDDFIRAVRLMTSLRSSAHGREMARAARRAVADEDWEMSLRRFERQLLETADDAARNGFVHARTA